MKTITLKSPDGKAKFTIGAYKAGETFEAFKGATGIFGARAGSKTAGLIYVAENSGTVHASDMDVDNETQWDWIAEWMQKGMDAENLLPALRLAEDALKNHVIETFGSLEAGHKWYLQYAADPKARRSDVVSMAALLNLSKVRGEALPVS